MRKGIIGSQGHQSGVRVILGEAANCNDWDSRRAAPTGVRPWTRRMACDRSTRAYKSRWAWMLQCVVPSVSVTGVPELNMIDSAETGSNSSGRIASSASLARVFISDWEAYCAWHCRLSVRESVCPVCPSAGKYDFGEHLSDRQGAGEKSITRSNGFREESLTLVQDLGHKRSPQAGAIVGSLYGRRTVRTAGSRAGIGDCQAGAQVTFYGDELYRQAGSRPSQDPAPVRGDPGSCRHRPVPLHPSSWQNGLAESQSSGQPCQPGRLPLR